MVYSFFKKKKTLQKYIKNYTFIFEILIENMSIVGQST